MLKSLPALIHASAGLSLLVFTAFLQSCSAPLWSKNADREVYGILRSQEVKLFGQPSEFDIGTPHSSSDRQEIEAVKIITGRREAQDRTINLAEAIDLSVRNRREYQSEKETLYLAGLDLTRARHDFEPRLGAGSQIAVEATDWQDGDDRDTHRTSVRNRAGFSQLLGTGGQLAVDLAQDIFKFHLGGGSAPPARFLAMRLSQPLLRGSGAVATENLTQRERNVAYAIRTFTRYQKRNALEITTSYYRILQEKDRVRNEYFNYRNLIAFTERASELAQDRLPRFQVDQARQDELRARNRYILAVNSYRNLVDGFKLTLGIPIGGELLLDDSVLQSLASTGLTPLPLDESRALEIAIARRLDLVNEVDRFEDAQRKLVVAADAFRPGLNLFASFSADSRGGRDYSNFNPEVYRSRLGLDIDLPLDNLEARNAYRRSEIDFDRQLRQLELALDRLQLEVRSGLRGLDLARERYEIQQNALSLANQRVEAVNLLLEADRAETRDILEARNDQLAASNAVTSALVDYHLTRLGVLHELGLFDPSLPRFWVENPSLPEIRGNNGGDHRVKPRAIASGDAVITPEELFQESSNANE